MGTPVFHELRRHAPFTALGACTGIIIMVFAHGLPHRIAYNTFYVLHPLHVVLSALVTAAMYKNYRCGTGRHGCNLWALLAIGLVGSIGIATLSDSLIPYCPIFILSNVKNKMAFIIEKKTIYYSTLCIL